MAYPCDDAKFHYKGKTYTEVEFRKVLKSLDLATLSKHVDGVTVIPDMPFKKTWQEMAFKHALRYAVENNYDAISWDTGETQADRYDLSKQVDSVRSYKSSDGTYTIAAIKDGETVIGKANLSPSDLENLVGKDLAQKIVNGEGKSINTDISRELGRDDREFSGMDLKVGGEGMKGFYDRILPQFVNKYTKKWGGKVEASSLPVRTSITGDLSQPPKTAVHSLEITPAMRESVAQGQPLFKAKTPQSHANVEHLTTLTGDELMELPADPLDAGKLNESGELEISERAGEILRKIHSTLYDLEAKSSDGALWKPKTFDIMVPAVRQAYEDAIEAGHDDTKVHWLNELANNLDDLGQQGKRHGIIYVFDDALEHERTHLEDALAGSTDEEARRALADSPFLTSPDFLADYGDYSPANKMAEVFAHLADDRGHYWKDMPGFEDAKQHFLATYADGIIRNNGIETLSQFEAFAEKYRRLAIYGNFAESIKKAGENHNGEAEGNERDAERGQEKGRAPPAGKGESETGQAPGESAEIPRSGKLKTLPKMTDNHIKPLSEYAPTLYRETNSAKALELLSGTSVDDRPYFANTLNLAKGQGENTGVTIELDSKGLQGQVNTSKPGWESVYQNGEAEFVGTYNKNYRNNVKSVTISKDTVPKSERLYRALDGDADFTKTNNADGSVTFSRIERLITPPETDISGNKPSKIGKSIERKAIESGLSEGFDKTAEYASIVNKDEIGKAVDLMAKDFEGSRAMIRGEKRVPDGVAPEALLIAMEKHAELAGDPDLLYEVSNSPITSESSIHAQKLQLFRERDPDSVAARVQDVRRARVAGIKKLLNGRTVEQALADEAAKIEKHVKAAKKTPIAKKTWNDFVDSLEC